MKSSCKAMKFASRMDFKPKHAGKAVGEVMKPAGRIGKTAGEKKMGNMTAPLVAKSYPHAQSSDGNGGK